MKIIHATIINKGTIATSLLLNAIDLAPIHAVMRTAITVTIATIASNMTTTRTKTMTLKDQILNAMETDDSFNQLNDNNIKRLYTKATKKEKELIDNLFINLCGYSISILLASNNSTKGQRKQRQ